MNTKRTAKTSIHIRLANQAFVRVASRVLLQAVVHPYPLMMKVESLHDCVTITFMFVKLRNSTLHVEIETFHIFIRV